jgi:hypothetical protein
MADPVLLKVLSITAGLRLSNAEVKVNMVHPLQRTQARVVPWLMVVSTELPLQSNADMVVSTVRPQLSNADMVPPQ